MPLDESRAAAYLLLYGTRPVTPRLLFTWLVLALCSGCVTAYQPLVSLQRPLAVDPEIANFEGQKVLVRCVPSDYLDPSDAELLCRKLRTLFTNQSATVEVEVPRKNASAPERSTFKPDLIIELRARLLHEANSAWGWLLCYASFTLIPAVTEFEFAQDITIRDSSGFMLATDSLQARFVRSFGIGVWGVNGLLDLIVRPKGEAITGDGHKKDFSHDFFGQVSQLAFHARMRAAVMNEFGKPLVAAPRPVTPTVAPITPPPPPPRGTP